MLRAAATAIASFALLAMAPPSTISEAGLAPVNPELRPVARAILKAQGKGSNPFHQSRQPCPLASRSGTRPDRADIRQFHSI